jgi:hypothetical protein
MAVFCDRQRSVSTANPEPAGEPGPKPDGELSVTLSIDESPGMYRIPLTPEALHTTTDFAFEVMTSGGPPRLRMVTYY